MAFAHNSGGEILTLQLGRSSNFVGAQFWNIQDELLSVDNSSEKHERNGRTDLADEEYADNHLERELRPELLFRITETSAVPRMVFVDFKQSVNTLQPTSQWTNASPSSIFALSDDQLQEHGSSLWDGNVEVHREEEIEKNDFLRWLEDGATAVENVALGSSSGSPYRNPYLSSPNEVAQTQQYGEFVQDEDQEDDGDLYMSKRVKDKDVKTWSDFLKAQLHHRSVNLLHRYGDVDMATFVSGSSIVREGTAELETILDSVRFFLEECDRLQGVHAIVDVNSGYGSIAETLIQELKEETGKASVFCFGVVEPDDKNPEDPKYESYLTWRKTNEAIAMSVFTDLCDMYTPMPLYSLGKLQNNPYFSCEQFNPKSLFHTSSLAAVGIDCLSLPYRRARPTYGPYSSVSMRELSSRMAPTDTTRLVGVSMGLPFPFPEIKSLELKMMFANWAPLNDAKSPLQVNLSCVSDWKPGHEEKYSTFATYGILRGTRVPNGESFDSQQSVERILESYCSRTSVRMAPSPMFSSIACPLPISLAFPDIFNNSLLGENGQVRVGGQQRQAPPISVPVFCHLENSTRIGGDVNVAYESISKRGVVTRFEYAKGPRGLDEDDFYSIRERLSHIRENYCFDGDN